MAARPKSDNPLNEVVTFRLDREMSEQMDSLRERDGIPFSEQIRRALHMFLEAKGVRPKKRKSA